MLEYLIFLIIAPMGAALLLFTLGAVLRFRKEPIGKTLLLYLSLILGALVVNLIELLLPMPEGTLLCGKLYFLFFPFIPLVWLLFSLQYTGLIYSFPPKRLLIFTIIPVLTAIAPHVPGLSGLFYQSVRFIRTGNFLTYRATYGPWFWIFGTHSYVLFFSGIIVVARSFFGSRKIFRVQSLLIIVGLVVPMCVNLMFVFRVFPGWHKDYTPVALSISGFFFFIGMYSHRLLHLIPVARNLVIKNLEMAIVVFDNSFRIVDYNPKAEELFQLNESVLGAVPGSSAVMFDILGTDLQNLVKMGEKPFVRQKNNAFYNCQIKKIETREDSHIGTILTVNDISDHIMLLEEKTNTVHQLEKINDELKKTQMHMIHREKLASIGQISAGIAHELNNPLSYIKSNLSVLDRYRKDFFPNAERCLEMHGKLTSEERKKVRESFADIGLIVDSSLEGLERIIEVVKNLLRFARADDSNLVKNYDLNEGLDTAINITASEFRYDAEIIREYGKIPDIECRGSEINQVIINILANAAQAAREAAAEGRGQQKIKVSTSLNKDNVTCIIENTGSEIPEEIRNKIFEPFYTTKKPGKGTGLGLSIAWDIIVKRHNGAITVESCANKTSFVIELPVRFVGEP